MKYTALKSSKPEWTVSTENTIFIKTTFYTFCEDISELDNFTMGLFKLMWD